MSGGGSGKTGKPLAPCLGEHAALFLAIKRVASKQAGHDAHAKFAGLFELRIHIGEIVFPRLLLDVLPINPFSEDAKSHVVDVVDRFFVEIVRLKLNAGPVWEIGPRKRIRGLHETCGGSENDSACE